MGNRLTLAIGLAASLGLAGCAESETSCTLIGCLDQLELRLRPATGTLPSGTYSVTVKTSTFERTFSCGVGTTSNPCPTSSAPFAEELALVDNALVLTLQQAPKSVTVTTSRDGTQIDEETLTPTYEQSFPNGVECGPVCEQGEAEVVLE